jgi:hypothetical protein
MRIFSIFAQVYSDRIFHSHISNKVNRVFISINFFKSFHFKYFSRFNFLCLRIFSSIFDFVNNFINAFNIFFRYPKLLFSPIFSSRDEYSVDSAPKISVDFVVKEFVKYFFVKSNFFFFQNFFRALFFFFILVLFIFILLFFI